MTWVFFHVIAGHLLRQPLRTLLQVLAIAAGVGLGYGVNLINASALAEFAAGLREVSGEADASVVGSRDGFSELLFGTVARRPEVEAASPLLEVRVPVLATGQEDPPLLTILGLDALRAARLSPALMPVPARAGPTALFGDGVFLSAEALDRFDLAVGEELTVQVGTGPVSLPIRGTLPGVREGEALGVMDLGYAQWRLGRLGQLSRIDLKLRPGTDVETLGTVLGLPPGVSLAGAGEAESRLQNLSRAYRVNLNVLALVALFTGAFLVFSLQAQAIIVRRAQLAFLRVAGITARSLQRLLLAEALLIGVVGSAVGIAAGIALARAALAVLGGDLGSGFFEGPSPTLKFSPGVALGFFGLGIMAAGAGGFVPARNVARARPAQALKAGAEEDAFRPLSTPWPGIVLVVSSAVIIRLPPVGGIPIGAYIGIGTLLVGVIALQPRLAALAFNGLSTWVGRQPWITRSPMLLLAVTRIAQAPSFAAIGMAGIVASFALMIAMATMVMSLRNAVTDWLDQILPADVYVRVGQASTSTFLSDRDMAVLAGHPGVERAEFSRFGRVLLAPGQPDVVLTIRPVDPARPRDSLPLTDQAMDWQPGMAPPVWVSEAVVNIYGAEVGSPLVLPLAGGRHEFMVAGVWRDYARQFGSIVIRDEDYQRITGDGTRTDAALWLKPGFPPARVMEELRARLDAGPVAEFSQPGDIRALSLGIFDRSFAITYVLELVAVFIGLVGIAATFSAQAIARTREFGMLRHVGVTKGQVLGLLAWEGALVTGLAILVGLGAGLLVAFVLVGIVNPVSFNWTMKFDVPQGIIAGLVVLLLTAATLTAVLAGRRAVSVQALRAVSEDW